MKKTFIAILSLIIIIGAIVLVLVNNKKTLDDKKVVIDRSEIQISVETQPVQMRSTSSDISLPATITAYEEANVSSASSGRISSLNIDLGVNVTKGQLIGTLDVEELELKLKAIELSIEKLNRDYERNKVLVAGNAANANLVADSKFELEGKKIEAAQLMKQISNASIIAPISGIVTDKKMISGEYANMGAVLATVVDIRTLKAKIYLSERTVFKLKLGQSVEFNSEVYPEQVFPGTVTYISPKGDDNHNYLIEVSIQNSKNIFLKAGMYGMVNFHAVNDQKSLQIPKIALVDGVKNPYVYVVLNGKAIERKLILGSENVEFIEVVGGLKEGDVIVLSGQINLMDGSNIKIINTNQ
jgi:RND family efflux transporter MFP subunit